MREAFLQCKSFTHIFNKNYRLIWDIKVWNFNDTLINDVVSYEHRALDDKMKMAQLLLLRVYQWILCQKSILSLSVYVNKSLFHLKMFGHTPIFFSAIFSKGDNFQDFLFAHLEDEIFPIRCLCLKERICSNGSKFFPLWDGLNLMEGNNENDRVAFHESVHIHFNSWSQDSVFQSAGQKIL